MAENGGILSGWWPPVSARSVASSKPDPAFERNWWSEAVVSTIQQMMAKQTRELQASFEEEAQKQRAMTQQLLRGQQQLLRGQQMMAEQTQQLRGCVEQLEGYLSAKGAAEKGPPARGGAEEQGGNEGEQDGLLETLQEFGATLSRIEEHLNPSGMSTVDLDSERMPDAPLGRISDTILDVRTPAGTLHLDPGEGLSDWCRAQCKKKRFGVCVWGMIMANCIFIGCEANAIMTSSDFSMPDSVPWRVARACFALAFLVELAIRWVADGYEFLRPRNEEFRWNLIDTLLILGIVANEALDLLSIKRVAFYAPRGLRVIRLLRVTHITREFKVVRELKELNRMITGLARCVRPLFWAGVLLFTLTYMMGIIVSQLIAEEFHAGRHAHLDEKFLRYITRNFPDLWRSMYSLFEALTGGRDWGEVAGPFIQVNWVLGVFLVLYIFVGIFGILNLLTAGVLDAAQRVDTADHVYAKIDWVNEVRTFIRRAIQDLPEDLKQTSVTPNGSLTKTGFFTLLDNPENKAYLKGNGLDLFLMDQKRLGELFDMMDKDGNGHLEVEEFVSAIYDHKGAASSMDLQEALHMIRSLQTQMEVTFRKSPRRSSLIHTRTSGLPVVGADV